MSYVISVNQNFARTLDEQAALRLAELSGTFAAFKYNQQDLPTRQEPRMFNIDHPFDWHTFDLFVGMFHPPGRLLDWAIDDVCEFVRLCHFFKVHENFLWQCVGVSLPRECPSFFSTSNTGDVLFCLKSWGYLRSAKRIISMAGQSDVNRDAFHLSDLLAAQTSEEYWGMILERYHQ